MNCVKICHVPLLAAILSVFPSTFSYAADFTIQVPVRLNNLHASVFAGSVWCAVRSSPVGVVGASVGQGFTRFTITSGSFNRTVVVQFNARPGADPGRARSYDCSLTLVARSSRGAFGVTQRNYTSVGRGLYNARPGTTPVFRLLGSLSRR